MSKFYEKQNRRITVKWTGSYPNLCSGKWRIWIGRQELEELEPKPYGGSLLSNDMQTEGEYSSWHFDENWSEEFNYYYDGMGFKDWLNSKVGKEMVELLDVNSIKLNSSEIKELFEKIQESDWRSGSCGGCI